jgi:hypothetical protein
MNPRNQNDEGNPSFVILDSGLIRHSGFWFRHSAAALAILAFAICSLAAAATSRGFLESDGATHFVFARHALEQPIFFIDIWGRPLCTALFAIPARFGGLFGVRATSMLCAMGCALVAMIIAAGSSSRDRAAPNPPLPVVRGRAGKGVEHQALLALIFTLGQPLLFLHSFSELTELPFALIIGLAFLCYQRQWWWGMAIFATISPLGRPEGFAFLILALAVLAIHRKWTPMIILPTGLIAWSIAGHILVGSDHGWWRWLIDHWPYESGSEYQRGPLLYYLAVLPTLVGPFAFPAIWIGVWRSARSDATGHQRQVDRAIAALPITLLAGYSVLFWLGKFSSSGALRYLLIVSPLWGCLTASGWQWIFERMKWRHAISWAALAVVTPGIVNWTYPFIPLKQSASWSQAEKFVRWYESSKLKQTHPRILCNHPGIFFYMGSSPWDRRFVEPWTPEAVDHPASDLVLLWDRDFCLGNSDPKMVIPIDRIKAAGWIEDAAAVELSDVGFADVPKEQLKWDKLDEFKVFVAAK